MSMKSDLDRKLKRNGPSCWWIRRSRIFLESMGEFLGKTARTPGKDDRSGGHEPSFLARKSSEQGGGGWYRGSLEFGGQRASDWWSLRGPHLYCKHSPLFLDFLPCHQEVPSVSTTIGTNSTDVFLLHVVTAAPYVSYTLCFITSLDLVSTQNDDITENPLPSAKLSTAKCHEKLLSGVTASSYVNS